MGVRIIPHKGVIVNLHDWKCGDWHHTYAFRHQWDSCHQQVCRCVTGGVVLCPAAGSRVGVRGDPWHNWENVCVCVLHSLIHILPLLVLQLWFTVERIPLLPILVLYAMSPESSPPNPTWPAAAVTKSQTVIKLSKLNCNYVNKVNYDSGEVYSVLVHLEFVYEGEIYGLESKIWSISEH